MFTVLLSEQLGMSCMNCHLEIGGLDPDLEGNSHTVPGRDRTSCSMIGPSIPESRWTGQDGPIIIDPNSLLRAVTAFM